MKRTTKILLFSLFSLFSLILLASLLNVKNVNAFTTITVQVNSSSDDCYVKRSGSTLLLNAYLPCGDFNSYDYDYESGMRFVNVTVPQGATIISAYLKLKGYSISGSYIIPTTRIIGENSSNPSTFSTYTDYVNRPRTSIEVNWTPSSWSTNVWYTSPNIKDIIQAIVNRADWSSGNALVLFWQHTLGWSGTEQWISAQSYDDPGDPANAPILEITYTISKWHSVESWNGVLHTIGWYAVESWFGSIVGWTWNLVEVWSGSIVGKCWSLVETWSGVFPELPMFYVRSVMLYVGLGGLFCFMPLLAFAGKKRSLHLLFVAFILLFLSWALLYTVSVTTNF